MITFDRELSRLRSNEMNIFKNQDLLHNDKKPLRTAVPLYAELIVYVIGEGGKRESVSQFMSLLQRLGDTKHTQSVLGMRFLGPGITMTLCTCSSGWILLTLSKFLTTIIEIDQRGRT